MYEFMFEQTPTPAQRSSKSADWGTPKPYIKAVRKTLGGIEFDPCTSPEHQKIVKATFYVCDRGLEQNWSNYLSVFCNPPGSKNGVQPWWAKFTTVQKGIWLGFNMNQLAYLDPNPLLFADWIFVPRRRIKYVGAGGNPPHNSYFVGVNCDGEKFARHCGEGTLRVL